MTASEATNRGEERRIADGVSDGCDHPVEDRIERDDGGDICSPSFYCIRCNRYVIERDPSSYSAPHPVADRAEVGHSSPQA